MNLRDLEYLVALDEHRHFGRAAQSVYVSQPTLSTQIKKMEAELGVELVERGPRTVIFTAPGERILRRARRILAEADEIRAIARQASNPHTGTLRIGVFPTLAPYFLPHIMPALTERFPSLEILLVEEKSAVLLDQLTKGSLDGALIAMPINDEGFHVEPMFREEFVLAAPAGHPLGQRSRLRMADLASEELLLLADGHCLRDQALEVCTQHGAVERRGFQATSLETLRLMVAEGVGMTLLPMLSVSAPVVHNPAIVIREFSDPKPCRDIALVTRKTAVQRELIDDLTEQIRDCLSTMVVQPLTG